MKETYEHVVCVAIMWFFLKGGFGLLNFISDIWFLWTCVVITVTAVDSASKALKFLGLVEDDLRTFDTPVASDIHQVQFSYKITHTYMA